MVRKSSFDFRGTTPQKFIAMNELSFQVLASNGCALACSVAEDMIKNDTINDSTDILARCASTTLAGGLRASISGLDPEMATGPSCDFDGIALQAVVTGMGCQVL